MLDRVLTLLQNAFIANRQNLDGILIAAKCIDSRLRSDAPDLISKLDIEKAFDCVHWGFLQKVLEKMCFGPRICRWIVISLQTGRFSILINGQPGFLFSTSHGLKQGDPASPYLFLAAIGVLSLMILATVDKKPGSNCKITSHMQFADNTIVFLNSCKAEVCVLKNILRSFELVSGLKINFSKNWLITIGACPELELYARILGCKTDTLTYLGSLELPSKLPQYGIHLLKSRKIVWLFGREIPYRGEAT